MHGWTNYHHKKLLEYSFSLLLSCLYATSRLPRIRKHLRGIHRGCRAVDHCRQRPLSELVCVGEVGPAGGGCLVCAPRGNRDGVGWLGLIAAGASQAIGHRKDVPGIEETHAVGAAWCRSKIRC